MSAESPFAVPSGYTAPVKVRCPRCNDTGWVAIRSREGAHAFPGPVPDDAKGYADADCWYCDSGTPPASAQP